MADTATRTRKSAEKPVLEDVQAYEPPSDPTPDQDIERLVPGPGEPVALASGTEVLVNPLKLREFLAMLKIVTRGAAMAMGSVNLDVTDEAFAQSMISLFIFAIPEAEEEAVDFVKLMVRPAGEFDEVEDRLEAHKALNDELDNPDLEDLFTILESVIVTESKDLRRLGKRLSSALAFARKTGQV